MLSSRLLPSRQQARARAREWLARHPRVEAFLRRTGCLSVHRRAVARGIAVGLFVGLTPTVGIQTVLMIGACLLLRANFPAAFVISWISNPLTVGPLYVAYSIIGETLLGSWLTFAIFSLFELTWTVASAVMEVAYVGLGSLLVAVPAALAGYLISLALHRYAALRRLRSRQA